MRKVPFIAAVKIAWTVFRLLRKPTGQIQYWHHEKFGVDDFVMFCAHGREAWRVSHLAIGTMWRS